MSKQDNLLNELISCEVELRRLQERADELRSRLGFSIGRRGASKKLSPHAQEAIEEAEAKPYRRITPAGKKAISEAQKARWAEYNRQKKAVKKAGARTVVPAAKKKENARRGRSISDYWASMTAAERKAEMHRRLAKRQARA